MFLSLPASLPFSNFESLVVIVRNNTIIILIYEIDSNATTLFVVAIRQKRKLMRLHSGGHNNSTLQFGRVSRVCPLSDISTYIYLNVL